jgi:hypothetical protein
MIFLYLIAGRIPGSTGISAGAGSGNEGQVIGVDTIDVGTRR